MTRPLRLTQEYKVSSCEQRLISEIEYRLERSPVEESGDEAPCGDTSGESGVAPFFEVKLKHYKIFEGMPATFTCRVTGHPKPKVSGDSLFRAACPEDGLASSLQGGGRRANARIEAVGVSVVQSCPALCEPTDCSCQAPLPMGLSRQEYWSGLPCPPPGGLPDPGIEPTSPALQVDSLLSEPPGKPLDSDRVEQNRVG